MQAFCEASHKADKALQCLLEYLETSRNSCHKTKELPSSSLVGLYEPKQSPCDALVSNHQMYITNSVDVNKDYYESSETMKYKNSSETEMESEETLEIDEGDHED